LGLIPVLKLLSRIPAGILGYPEMTRISSLFQNSIFFPVAGDLNRNPEKTTKVEAKHFYGKKRVAARIEDLGDTNYLMKAADEWGEKRRKEK
jgi:hypothetical protein